MRSVTISYELTPLSFLMHNIKAEIRALSKHSVRDFCSKINIQIPPFVQDSLLQQRVSETLNSWSLTEPVRPHDVAGIMMATCAFGHLSLEVRVPVALYVTLCMIMDDPVLLPTPEELRRQLCAPDCATVLGRFLELLHGMWAHYPPFGACGIFASSISALNIGFLDRDRDTLGFLPTKSMRYVEYHRVFSSVAEGYAFLIWQKAHFPNPAVYVEALP